MQYILTTLGCKTNQYESSALNAQMEALGWRSAPNIETAEVFIVNSCTVTENSDKKTRRLLASAKSTNPQVITVLTGCFPQAYPEQAEKLGADIVCGTADRERLPALIEKFVQNRANIDRIAPSPEAYEEFGVFNTNTKRTRAFIKIQDGCDSNCAYCIVPKARGTPRSRPLEAVEAEAKAVAEAGYKEIVLTGINLTKHFDLCGAVHITAKYAERVRLSSVEPDLLTDEMLEKLSREPKLCPHFHLSLQSGSNGVLQRMNRRYTAEEYRKKVQKIRELFREKEPAFTTDMMVGYPGETEEEFAESLSLAREIGFSKIHVFAFSPRPGTKAAEMPLQVPENVKRERRDRLLQTAGELRSKFLNAQIGRTLSVLVEKENFGHAENYAPVKIINIGCEASDIPLIKRNEIIKIKIIKRGEQNNVGLQYLYGEKA
jgi:threonylcarbamoyladenosine tRNA methylthiotransferase MtaB